MSKALVIIKSMGIGDLCILISNIHAISKKISQPITVLAQKNTRAMEILKDDPHVSEVIELDEKEVKSFYKVLKSNIIVVHDDLDLPIGKIKIKLGGGNGGHNGLLNIDKTIGVNYNRLRIGIGHPGIKELVNKYVLENLI